MKRILQTIIIVFQIILLQLTPVFSQNASKTGFSPNNNWVLYKEINNVQIFVCNKDCHDNANGLHYEYLLLKFINTSSQSKQIKWSEKLFYNGNCVGCEEKSNELSFEAELLPNQTKQGECNDNNDTFRIFSKFLNYKDNPYLTNYELNNIEVK